MHHGHLLAAFVVAGLFLGAGSSFAQVATTSSEVAQEVDSHTENLAVVTEPRIGIPGEPINFLVGESAAPPTWFHWQFGDSTFSHEPTPAHTYSAPGVHEASLTAVVDEDTLHLAFLVVVEPDWCPEVIELNAIAFARNRHSISNADEAGQRAAAMLAENLDVLATCPSLQVTILGAASERERMPIVLARERAEALLQYYVDSGLNPDRFRAEGQPEPVEPSPHSGPQTASIITGSKR